VHNRHSPDWRGLRKVALAGLALALAGLVIAAAGLTAPGVVLVTAAVFGVPLVCWLMLMLPAVRNSRRHPPSSATSVRNSDFGFVAELWRSTEPAPRPTRTEHDER
jgi:hypothetical protein